MVVDQIAQQGPFIIKFFQIGFDQQHFQLIFIESEYDAVDGNTDDPIVFQLFEDRPDVYLTCRRVCPAPARYG